MALPCPHNARLEVCIASLDDAIVAAHSGADRLELNSALALGGLTPSLGLMRSVRKAVKLPIIAMVRPRAGGFCYDDSDLTVMVEDAAALLHEGADGVAFGVLKEDGNVDVQRSALLMHVIGSKQAVFHRAFDVTPDPFAAMEALIDLGVTRIMTSGQQPTAEAGTKLIKELIERAAGRIEILPAGSIRPHNVAALIEATKCDQVHASLRSLREDRSTQANPALRFSLEQNLREDQFDGTDEAMVRAMVEMMRGGADVGRLF